MVFDIIVINAMTSICPDNKTAHSLQCSFSAVQIGIIFLALISAMFGVLTALFHGVYMTESFDVDANNTEQVQAIQQQIASLLHHNDQSDSCANGTL